MSGLTASQVRRAERMASYGYRYVAIARALDVKPEAVEKALLAPSVAIIMREVTSTIPDGVDDGLHRGRPPFTKRNADEVRAFAERERRYQASLRQSLTATIFGDPPPGFSALDKQPANLSANPLPSTDIKAGLSK